MDELKFTTAEPIQVSVTIDDKKFVLKEATEGAWIAHYEVITRDTNGHITDASVQESNLYLLARSLFEVAENNGNLLPVKPDYVKSLPRRITKALISKLDHISSKLEDIETEEFLKARIISDQQKLDDIKKGNTVTKN